jgi:kumamolisin
VGTMDAMTYTSRRAVRPRASTDNPYTAREVADAYGFPLDYDGAGTTCGIIELGGGYNPADSPDARVTVISVNGGQSESDGPDGADGEVALDVQIVAQIAPAADINVYFAPNTDDGFRAAVERAVADRVDVLSISWGAPETAWDPTAIREFDAACAHARAAGVVVLCASGDTGSRDGTSENVADFPASSPNVIGCGGTELTLDNSGRRADEVAWDVDDTRSASGGGLSRMFPGRAVPDIAGNASPRTGYAITIAGDAYVIGGTSAVAPLYAGLVLLLSDALGTRLGDRVDLMNTLLTNLGVMFDVTAGDNGGYRAGVGRDQVTGLGVVDGGLLLQVLTDDIADPAPVGGPAAPADPDAEFIAAARHWVSLRHSSKPNTEFERACIKWLEGKP